MKLIKTRKPTMPRVYYKSGGTFSLMGKYLILLVIIISPSVFGFPRIRIVELKSTNPGIQDVMSVPGELLFFLSFLTYLAHLLMSIDVALSLKEKVLNCLHG